MNKEELIKHTERFVKQKISGFDSGHDWWHIERVRKLALYINKEESLADPFTLEIAALLHDSADSKFTGENYEHELLLIEEFMDRSGMKELTEQVIGSIRNVSFSNKHPEGNLNDPILLIIQDADRLDAIGAIGIARAFNYGGFRNNPIYVPDDGTGTTVPSTISHFYEKLLVLKSKMNTLTAQRLAVERHEFLEIFLKQFNKERGFGTENQPDL